MEVESTPIEGLKIIHPKVFKDERGYFFESYSSKVFKDLGIENNFVQDNESFSTYGTLRGLHLQRGEHAQAKLVRVVQGEILDVAVDLREGSVTYGQSYSIVLSAENKKQFLIPRGFAHGFSVLSETVIFNYKCDNLYNKESEDGIMYNDPDLNIDWKVPEDKILLSDKDKKQKLLKDFIPV